MTSVRVPLSLSAWLRYDAVRRLLPAEASRVLEIGAGMGSFGALLAQRYDYVGLEPDDNSYEVAVRRVGAAGLVLNETVEEVELQELFDVMCAFEVLEHIEDDRGALAGWLRHVSPGGYVLLSVPFARERFGPWDRKAGHYRRYDAADVVDVMESVGLRSIETIVYGFPLGRALEIARNGVARAQRYEETMEERTAVSGRQLQPPAWAAALMKFGATPFCYLQRPFSRSSLGTGIVARGRA
jgi:SAM-dependent methyltransferase